MDDDDEKWQADEDARRAKMGVEADPWDDDKVSAWGVWGFGPAKAEAPPNGTSSPRAVSLNIRET
jgi:hypothetical protein